MGTAWRDLRYGFRMLVRNKGFTAVAILALALGIGPNVAMFSIIYATFLAPMPYPEAKQLVVVWNMIKGERGMTRADDFAQYRAQSKSFQCMDFPSYNILYLTNPDHTDSEVASQYGLIPQCSSVSCCGSPIVNCGGSLPCQVGELRDPKVREVLASISSTMPVLIANCRGEYEAFSSDHPYWNEAKPWRPDAALANASAFRIDNLASR